MGVWGDKFPQQGVWGTGPPFCFFFAFFHTKRVSLSAESVRNDVPPVFIRSGRIVTERSLVPGGARFALARDGAILPLSCFLAGRVRTDGRHGSLSKPNLVFHEIRPTGGFRIVVL